MQAQQLSSWTAPILAFCLSLLLSVTLAPTLGLVTYQQYDFWLLWLVTMLILALPFTLLELALAKRAKAAPLQAFLQLTRDADRSTHWRLMSWAALVFVPFLVGSILHFAAEKVQISMGLGLDTSVLLLILAIGGFALSMLPRIALLAITAIATLIFAVLSMLQSTQSTWQWTNIEFVEWAKVVTLTLVTGGLGLGLYWQNMIHAVKQKQSLTPLALPIWIAQALGLGSVMFVAQMQGATQAILFLVAALGLAGLLLQFVREQAIERGLPLLIQAVILLVPLLLWAIPQTSAIFYGLIIVYGLVLCLFNTIFVGWLMKISHLRKSLSFANEATYNIWRVFIRIVMPLSIVVALIGWLSVITGA